MGTALLLGSTAAVIGVVHTLAGPDHYVPFTVLAKARGWGAWRTAWITLLCGLGHVASSVVLGASGIWAGLTVNHLAGLEEVRGSLASWGLLVFGLLYGVWGLKRATRGRTHRHVHHHGGEGAHDHAHDHHGEHLHVHAGAPGAGTTTPWVLFIVFVFGPCEPLIPLVMATYAASGAAATAWVSAVFSAATVATMLAVVLPARAGLSKLALGRMEPYSHALAGGTIALCGIGMVFFGL